MGFSGSSAGKEPHLQCRRPLFNSWVGKISWKRDRLLTPVCLGFPDGSDGRNLPAVRETWVQSLSLEDALEESMASVHGISQARILQWVATSFSRGSSGLRDHRASPSASQLLAFSPGQEQAAGVWET